MSIKTDSAGNYYIGSFLSPGVPGYFMDKGQDDIKFDRLLESAGGFTTRNNSNDILGFSYDTDVSGTIDSVQYLSSISSATTDIDFAIDFGGGSSAAFLIHPGGGADNYIEFSEERSSNVGDDIVRNRKQGYAVMSSDGKQVAVWGVDDPNNPNNYTFFYMGELRDTSLSSPENRAILTQVNVIGSPQRAALGVTSEGSTVKQYYYHSNSTANFTIDCSDNSSAECTWLKLRRTTDGAVIGNTKNVLLYSSGTTFDVNQIVQIDSALPDGGSRLFICCGDFGDGSGQLLMRILEG